MVCDYVQEELNMAWSRSITRAHSHTNACIFLELRCPNKGQ